MGRGHHPTASPSSLPAKAQCPCFKSGEPGEEANAGTIMHSSLECLITGKENPYHEMLTEEQRRQVAYALEVYMTWTDQDREVEVELSLIENDLVTPKEEEKKKIAKALNLKVKDIFTIETANE